MPRTKLQDLVFSVIMVVLMVYAMTLFNVARDMGLSYQTFLIALQEMWVEAVVAFLVQRYVAGPFARRTVGRLFAGAAPGVGSIAAAGCNVMLMAPLMTLFVCALHNGISAQLPLIWLSRLVLNFPFALCVQVFYAGPLARCMFRAFFRKQLAVGTGVAA